MFRACFAGDMLLDAEGGKKRADAIQVGDRLWARDEFDPAGPLALKEVEEVFVRSAPLWNLHVAGQRLKTTAEHPFYVVGQGWVPAGMLQIGDRLLTQDGRAVPVEGVAPSGQRVTVYNWRIAEYHTYYVSAAETSPSLWAHNADYNVGAGASESPRSQLPASESWGNPSTLSRHFRDHGADFGARTPEEYASMASDFFQSSQVQGLPTRIDSEGIIRIYDPATNTFGAFNPNGSTRTFFRPTSPTYWDRQPGSAPIILGDG